MIAMVMAVRKLGNDVEITLDLSLALEGGVKSEHSLQMALNELRQRVNGVAVEDVGKDG